MSDNPLRIPRNVLEAARRAGLSYPTWYVGRREAPASPRRKTLADLARDIETREAGRRFVSVRPDNEEAKQP